MEKKKLEMKSRLEERIKTQKKQIKEEMEEEAKQMMEIISQSVYFEKIIFKIDDRMSQLSYSKLCCYYEKVYYFFEEGLKKEKVRNVLPGTLQRLFQTDHSLLFLLNSSFKIFCLEFIDSLIVPFLSRLDLDLSPYDVSNIDESCTHNFVSLCLDFLNLFHDNLSSLP